MGNRDNKTVGQQGGTCSRFTVINIMDPLEAFRVQVREVGNQNDMSGIPDSGCPWVQCGGGLDTAGMQGMSGTNGILPGTTLVGSRMGSDGQDIVCYSTEPNALKGANQTAPKGTNDEGKKEVSSAENYDSRKFAFGEHISQYVESRTTEKARQNRTKDLHANRTEDPVERARNKDDTEKPYGRKKAKDADKNGDSIGTKKFDNSKKIKSTLDGIGNKSAIIKSAKDAIDKLKQVSGNPTSIDSIGAGNFQQIMSQLSQWFGGGSAGNAGGQGNQEQAKEFDCEHLKEIPETLLTDEQRETLRICLLVEDQIRQDQNDGVA